ncbi:MAG: class I tRNA ligase family protein, partial [Myxococcota bacterium]
MAAPFEPVTPQVSLAELDQRQLAFWEDERIFERSVEANADAKSFVFYEGPPTANGMPHAGHVLTRVMKDVFLRYRSMCGYRVPRRAGWDTHGLPVEVEVEKALGINGRQAIADYGVEAFARKCIDSVFVYIDEWRKMTQRIGFWVDLDDAYVTFHKAYVESVWWALKRFYDEGLLYQDYKVVWWWAQGGTALSAGEVGQGYKEVDDPSVMVRFPVVAKPGRSFLACNQSRGFTADCSAFGRRRDQHHSRSRWGF